MPAPRVSVVVVAHNSAAALERTLPGLVSELEPGDELVVVDNASGDGSVETARRRAPAAQVIEAGANLGFPAACNVGAAASTGELLVFLNPDAVPARGFGAAIRAPWAREPLWGAWQALVTAEDGQVVNSAGNQVHVIGIAWAGQAGVALATADVHAREIAYGSGACLAVRREAFDAVGGFDGSLFLYHEDLDLSLRLRLAGWRIGLEPEARAEHDYDFAKGGYKWRLMERNRVAVIVRCWPGRVLLAALPLIVAAEPAVWLAALRGRWVAPKRRALAESVRAMPRLVRERRAIQGGRRIGAAEFAAWLTPRLSSELLGPLAGSRKLDGALRAYWWAATRAVGIASPRGLG